MSNKMSIADAMRSVMTQLRELTAANNKALKQGDKLMDRGGRNDRH